MPLRVTSSYSLQTPSTLFDGTEIAGATSATFGFWVKIDEGTTYSGNFNEHTRVGPIVFRKSTNTTSNRHNVFCATELGDASGPSVSLTFDLEYGVWNFILVRIQSGTQELYINNVLTTTDNEVFDTLDDSSTGRLIRMPVSVTDSIQSGGMEFNGIFVLNKYVSDTEKTNLYSGDSVPQNITGVTFSFVIPMNEETPSSVSLSDADLQNIGNSSYNFTAADGSATRVAGNQHSWSSETTPPTLQSATINNSEPNKVYLVFSENVTASSGAGFSLSGTTSTSFSSISGSGTNTIVGTLATNAQFGQNIIISYNSATGNVEDISGNALETFSSTPVTNNIQNASAPQLLSATVSNSQRNRVTLTFNETVTASSGAGFSLSGTTSTSFSSISGSGTETLVATITNNVQPGEIITLSYNNTTGNVVNNNSVKLNSFTGFSVQNNTVNATANEFIVFEHGDESILDLALESSGGAIGAWVNGQWQESSTDALIDNLVMYANGQTVGVHRIIAQSVNKSQNPNAATLWPHLQGSSGVQGNKIRYWIEHDIIDRDAVVTYTLPKGIVTQGSFSNFAASNSSVTQQLSNYKSDIRDQISSNTDCVFIDTTNGTTPKLPIALSGFGSATATWNVGDSINASQLNGTQNAVISVDISREGYDANVTPMGPLFSIGDSNNGFTASFDTDGYFRAIVGSAEQNVSITARQGRDVVAGSGNSVAHTWPAGSYTLTFHIDVTNGRFACYIEGIKVAEATGTIGNWVGTGTGKFGEIASDYLRHPSSPVAPPTVFQRVSIDSTLKYWQNTNVNIGVTGSSKDWFPYPTVTLVDMYTQYPPLESEFRKYVYKKSDFTNIQSSSSLRSGTFYALKSKELLRQIFETLPNVVRGCALYKSGDIQYGNTLEGQAGINISRGLRGECIKLTSGASKTAPYVAMLYDGTTPVTIDLTTLEQDSLIAPEFLVVEESYVVVQDRMFIVKAKNVEGNTSFPEHGGMRVNCFRNSKSCRIGGIFFEDLPSNAIVFFNPQSAEINGVTGFTFGQMCFKNCGYNNGRSYCFGSGGHSLNQLARVQLDVCLYNNGNDYTKLQAHGCYIKGHIDYLRLKGGWFPMGPGGAIKNDGLKNTVTENWIAWRHRGAAGSHHNGTSNQGGPAILPLDADITTQMFISSGGYNGGTTVGVQAGSVLDNNTEVVVSIPLMQDQSFTFNAQRDLGVKIYSIRGSLYSERTDLTESLVRSKLNAIDVSHGFYINDSGIITSAVGFDFTGNGNTATETTPIKITYDSGDAGRLSFVVNGTTVASSLNPGDDHYMFMSFYTDSSNGSGTDRIVPSINRTGRLRDRSIRAASWAERVCHQNILAFDMYDWDSTMVASIDCEVRNFIFVTPNDQRGFLIKPTGNSKPETELYSDGYSSGWHNGTILTRNGGEVQSARHHDNLQSGGIGFHSYYLNRILLNTLRNDRFGLYIYGDNLLDEKIEDAYADNRSSNFKVISSNIYQPDGFIVINGTDEYSAITGAGGAAESIADGEMFISCGSASVTFVGNLDTSGNVIFDYFRSYGYTIDESDPSDTQPDQEIIDAIANSWLDGWDTLPEELKIDTIIAYFKSAFEPVGLNASDYGGVIPGYFTSSSTDETAPTLQSATISNSFPNRINLTFDESVIGSTAGFTITGTSSSTFASFTGSGSNTLVGTLSQNALFGQTIAISYNSATGNITDFASNDLASFSGITVLNGIVQTQPPVLLGATISQANPNKIVMKFNESVSGSTLGFTISGVTPNRFTLMGGSGTDTLTGTMSQNAQPNQIIRFSYSSATGEVENSSGIPLASFNNIRVINLVTDGNKPQLDSAIVDISSPNQIILIFNEAVTGSTYGGFSLTGTSSGSFNGLSGFGTNTLTGTVSNAILGGQSITLGYDSSVGNIRDISGLTLGDIDTFNVSNNQAPYFISAAVKNSTPNIIGVTLSHAVFGEEVGISVSGSSPITVTSINGFGTRNLSLNTSRNIAYQETIRLSYSGNSIVYVDSNDNPLTPFTNQPVLNLVNDLPEISISDSGGITLANGSSYFTGEFIESGTPEEFTFRIKNISDVSLFVSSATLTNNVDNKYSFDTGITTGGITLAAGQVQNIVVACDVATAGTKTATLNVVSNDPVKPLYLIDLTTVVEEQVVGRELSVSSAKGGESNNNGTLNLGRITLSDSVYKFSIYVTNIGTQSITLGSGAFNISGSDFSFQSGTSFPLSLPAGSRSRLVIDLDTSSIGNKTGTLTITSNAQNSPFTLNLRANVGREDTTGASGGAWARRNVREAVPTFLNDIEKNSAILTERGWEMRSPGNGNPQAFEVLVSGNFANISSAEENNNPYVYTGAYSYRDPITGFVGTTINPTFIEVYDLDTTTGQAFLGINEQSNFPTGIIITRISDASYKGYVYRLTGNPSDPSTSTAYIEFIDAGGATTGINIPFRIRRR